MHRLTFPPDTSITETPQTPVMRLLPLPLLLLTLLATTPVLAKVIANGKPSSGGYYWQKVENANGKVSYLCRKQGIGQVQKDAACNGAKAAKP